MPLEERPEVDRHVLRQQVQKDVRPAVRVEADRQLVGEVPSRLARRPRGTSARADPAAECDASSVKCASLSCSVASQVRSRSASTASSSISRSTARGQRRRPPVAVVRLADGA